MHRRRARAVRYTGFSSRVSTRALIMRRVLPGPFDHDGTSPQYMPATFRTGWSCPRVTTTGIVWVGAMLNRGRIHCG